MHAAGGLVMDIRTRKYAFIAYITLIMRITSYDTNTSRYCFLFCILYSLQYMVREHLVEESNSHQRKAGHGIIRT